MVAHLKELIDELSSQISALTKEIEQWNSTNVDSKRIAEIPRIGPITATALVASIGDPSPFNNGRQVSAWIGLVPKQFSASGKQVLLGISKQGDGYLRRLLVHGARAVLGHLKQQPTTYTHRWLNDLLKRKHKNVAIVVLANQQHYNPELLSI